MTNKNIEKISVDIIIPVYNEEKILKKSVKQLMGFLKKRFRYDWKIVIADNASIDKTQEVGEALQKKYNKVKYVRIPQKGRGRALRKTWLDSKADIVSYMDVDLSTQLDAFPVMISALVNGFDVGTGSRLMSYAAVKRSLKREILSRGYNLLVRMFLNTHFSDAQCGFKAVRKDVARKLIPLIKDDEWFFDTELLVLAEKKGYRIFEIPVGWIEDKDSRVHIRKTVTDYIKSLFRMRVGLFEKGYGKHEISSMGAKFLKLRKRLGNKK
ncbi:dolichyl-phosphate beta-glucosyltransferase [Nanoarchaeota archaeon]